MSKPIYPNLMAEMARKGDTLTSLSKWLEMSLPLLHSRVSGKTMWKIHEIDKLCNRYDTDYETLFKRGD